MKTRKASSHVIAIHVYPPSDQTTVVENRNVVVLKLGEATLKRWSKMATKLRSLFLDGLSSDEGEGHSKSTDSDDFDPQWVFLFHDDTDIDKEWCFMEIRTLKSIFCCGSQWMWWEPDCCLWWEDGMLERNQTCLWGLFLLPPVTAHHKIYHLLNLTHSNF